ncbi:MAG: hypothetical protein PVH87_13000, partial [Desulfobacteraceae bacterium]
LKKRILVQDVGGAGFRTAGILQYVEDSKAGTNTRIRPKDFFEMASSNCLKKMILNACFDIIRMAAGLLCAALCTLIIGL